MFRNDWKSRFDMVRYSSNTLGLLATILAVVAWAIAGNVANHLFLAGVQPFELAGASTAIATFGFAILDCLVGRSHARAIDRQQFAMGLILVGLVGTTYLSIQRLPVAVATVLLFTAPILVVLWTALTSRKLPSLQVIIALIFSIVGVILMSNLLSSNVVVVDWLGILVGLSAAVFFAAYVVLSEQVSATRETTGVMLKIFAVASLFWIAYQTTQGIPRALLAPDNIPSVIYMGLGGNLLPYLLFFWCVQRLKAERAAIAATLEPPIAGFLAWIWFGQSLTLMQILGGVLIVAAITWMQLQIEDSS